MAVVFFAIAGYLTPRAPACDRGTALQGETGANGVPGGGRAEDVAGRLDLRHPRPAHSAALLESERAGGRAIFMPVVTGLGIWITAKAML